MAWWKQTNWQALSDDALLEQIGQGNRHAFSELYDRYAHRLFRFANKMLGFDQEKARDVVQDCFLKIMEQPQLFKAGYKVQSWIFTMVANRCRNEIRNHLHRKQLLAEIGWSEDSSIEPHYTAPDREAFRKAADKVFEELEEDSQLIFVLRFQQELKLREIAEILNIPEGTVKSRIHYLLQHLARELAPFQHQL